MTFSDGNVSTAFSAETNNSLPPSTLTETAKMEWSPEPFDSRTVKDRTKIKSPSILRIYCSKHERNNNRGKRRTEQRHRNTWSCVCPKNTDAPVFLQTLIQLVIPLLIYSHEARNIAQHDSEYRHLIFILQNAAQSPKNPGLQTPLTSTWKDLIYTPQGVYRWLYHLIMGKSQNFISTKNGPNWTKMTSCELDMPVVYPSMLSTKAHLLHTFPTKFFIKPFNPCLSVFSAQIACIFLQELQLIWTCLPTLRYNSDWLVNHDS